ncbi:hypothetical protein [Lactobacillus helveticus]|uniref:hypothetical protein n=2 Tax=Lactobacillus helveticus TaxID=1587 RepID=UPI001C275DC1|nr:hypothetical protein [Lactobacillus helveticus]
MSIFYYFGQEKMIKKFSATKLTPKNKQRVFNVSYLFLQEIFTQLELKKTCQDTQAKTNTHYDLYEIPA